MKKLILIAAIPTLFFSCQKKQGATVQTNQTDTHQKIIQNKYAEALGVSPSHITDVALYTFVDDWIGTKYQYGGMSKTGVDCSGFCNVLYNNVYKKQLPRTTKEIAKQIKKVNKEKLQEGNVVVFNIANKKNSHIGIYLQNNKFVHASTSKGVIISSLQNPYYLKAYSKGGGI